MAVVHALRSRNTAGGPTTGTQARPATDAVHVDVITIIVGRAARVRGVVVVIACAAPLRFRPHRYHRGVVQRRRVAGRHVPHVLRARAECAV